MKMMLIIILSVTLEIGQIVNKNYKFKLNSIKFGHLSNLKIIGNLPNVNLYY